MITVRAATAADHETLVDYVITEATEAEGRSVARATIAAAVGAALADPALSRYWIAEASGAPIGAIAVTREWSDWNNGSYWYIQFVFVAVAHRGQGALRALVDEVRAAAGRDGAPELRLYVHPTN